jgi:signal peptidase I
MEIIKETNNKEANKSQKKEKKKKSKLREWVDALVFAIIVASFIRWIFMEAFTIPTPSMEGSLLTGDFLFVSKIHYGARTPQTPLQLPLTHQTIWWTDLPSYLTWIQLPIYRIPGLVSVKNNDVVVFNYPPKEDGKPEYPTDLKTNYIKRCMGIAGDTIEVRDLQVYINGKKALNPPELQYRYLVLTDTRINDKVFQSNDITDYHEVYNGGGYIIFTTPAKINGLKKLSFVKDVLWTSK